MRHPCISDGFQLHSVTLCDIDNEHVLWKCEDDLSVPYKVHEIRIPVKILNCRAVKREINFSSVMPIDYLRLEQKIYFKGRCLEEWFFEFGHVTANSTNTWISVIEATPESRMMPAFVLNGNLILETKFFNYDTLITTSEIKLYYV